MRNFIIASLILLPTTLSRGSDCSRYIPQVIGETEEKRINKWLQALGESTKYSPELLDEGNWVMAVALQSGPQPTKSEEKYEYYLYEGDGLASTLQQRRQITDLAEFISLYVPSVRGVRVDIYGKIAWGWLKLDVTGPPEKLSNFTTIFSFLIPRLGKLIGDPFATNPFP